MDDKEQLNQLKKEKEEQRTEILRFNESLLAELKQTVSKEVFGLIIGERWGPLDKLETTDRILDYFLKLIREIKVGYENKIAELKSASTKREKLIQDFMNRQSLAEENSRESDLKIEELNQRIERGIKVQQDLYTKIEQGKQAVIELNKELLKVSEKGETAETELNQRIAELNNLIQEKETEILNLREGLVEDWENSLETSRAITEFQNEKRKPSLIEDTITERVELSDMTYETIGKIVAKFVPVFAGQRTPDLPNKVYEFLNACEVAFKCIDKAEEKLFVHVLSTRLVGDAFELIRAHNPETWVALQALIKTTYLPVRTLEHVTNELKNTRQIYAEDIKSYARRLLSAEMKAKDIIAISYDRTDSVALLKEIHNSVITTFKLGLLDPNLRQYMLTCTEENLDKLVEMATKTSLLLNSPPNYNWQNYPSISGQIQNPFFLPQMANTHASQIDTINANRFQYTQPHLTYQNFHQPQQNLSIPFQTFNPFPIGEGIIPTPNLVETQVRMPEASKIQTQQSKVKCGFCSKPNHTYAECRQRLNTPYCDNCKVNGHSCATCPAKIRATKTVRNRVKCNWCSRFGHSEDACFVPDRPTPSYE